MTIPEDFIVRIFGTHDQPVGAGFLVSPNLVMTCFHVVQAATGTGELGRSLQIDLPLVKGAKSITCRVVFMDHDRDVACLLVEASLPANSHTAKLTIIENLWGHSFRVFGYPRGHANGVWASGVLRSSTGDGWLQIEDVKETGFTIQPGFSGGPVWDEQLQAVVGMVVAAEANPDVKTAFCIPTRYLADSYPALAEYAIPICPYRSLDVFTENDKLFFFGRSQVISKLINSLKGKLRFLAVLGPSGSGKSSVIRAGLIPALKEGMVPGSEKWHTITIRPGIRPDLQLKGMLVDIQDNLENSVITWLASHPTIKRLVLFIDQFEELLITTPKDIRQAFIADIAGLLESALPVTLIFTMRDDFYSRFLQEAPPLAGWLELGLVNIPPALNVEEIQSMIVGPSEQVGVKFEEGLVDLIVSDASVVDRSEGEIRSTILPLLEFALTQMWDARQGNVMTHLNYKSIGGVSGGLTQWADHAYYSLTQDERLAARRILTDLVNFGDEIQGIPNTKRIKKYEDLTHTDTAQQVVQKLVQARLLVAGHDTSLKQNNVEIIHEALIYKWSQFSKWIEEDREFLGVRNQFTESAKEWEKLGRDSGLLYRGARLENLIRWLNVRKNESLSDLEQDFLQESTRQDKLLEHILSSLTEISSYLDLELAFNHTLTLINEAVGADQGTILLFNAEENILQYKAGYDYLNLSQAGRNDGLAEWVMEHREIALIQDLLMDPRWIQTPSTPVYRSAIAVPLVAEEDVAGVLMVFHLKPNFFRAELVGTVKAIADQVAVVIQTGRIFDETRRLAEELEQRVVERTGQLMREQKNTETLLRILTEVSSSLDLDRALTRTLSLLNESIGAEQGTIMLIDWEDNLLHYRAGYGYLNDSNDTMGHDFKLRVGEGLAGWVVANRESVLIGDVRQDERWILSPQIGQDHCSAIAAPLIVAEDAIGVLLVFHRSKNFFSPEMLNLVKAISNQVSVAINNAQLYELIRMQAERLGLMLRKEQEEASRSQAILQAVADGVLVTGADNRITFINSSIERILMLEESSLLGRPLDAFSGMFGKSDQAWQETIHAWSENPASYQSGDSYAEQLELENGRIVLVHLAPVILQNDFLGTVSIFRDITHEVEVDRLKSEFIASVSHELRVPMTSIKGYVDILRMGAAGSVNENQAHFLDIVTTNLERLDTMVNDILDISRIEYKSATLALESTELRPIAEEVIREAQQRAFAENKPLRFSLNTSSSLPPVYADAQRVRQILFNLVDNACKYTPNEGAVRIDIQPVSESEIQIDVQDTGIGISPSEQDHIFERFYRGEDPLVLSTPGTGLGLPIVRNLVELHKGRIWMESSGISGNGSRFSFTLPIHRAS